MLEPSTVQYYRVGFLNNFVKHKPRPLKPRLTMAAERSYEDDVQMQVEDDEFDDEEDDQNWDDWGADNDEEGGDNEDAKLELLCLFCDSLESSCNALFDHCAAIHRFDFNSIKKLFRLDFYGCFKLFNYIRSQVAENRCWGCGAVCQSKQDLQRHLHEVVSLKGDRCPWDDDKYLKPFMEDDALLYSFGEDDEGEDEDFMSVDHKEVIGDLSSFERICIDDNEVSEGSSSKLKTPHENGGNGVTLAPASDLNMVDPVQRLTQNGDDAADDFVSCKRNLKGTEFGGTSSAMVVANEIKKINKNYFGSYSSFGIHREMISDKVRTDAYRQAILENPSLFRGAVVMDVGCGTVILSLFAAKAGASRVFAVEASEKMAVVATQIAKDNGCLWSGSPGESTRGTSAVIEVVQGMVEKHDCEKRFQPHSVDVLVSEWMGYCLLYESMLSSVLLARDRWLKPGGAILPDTATMFAAGFGRGGTSIPFWENVYGFNMSCIGKELVEDAAQIPIIDVIDGRDIVTNTTVLQTFDLVTMKADEMDFTATVELEPKLDTNCSGESRPEITWCHGIVLWFETGFTSRFCKELPTVLSTSPYTATTHWSQTILTFREPIAVGSHVVGDKLAAVGTDACPAVRIRCRISIARAARHRSIDISMEIGGIGPDGRKRSWPVQIFDLA